MSEMMKPGVVAAKISAAVPAVGDKMTVPHELLIDRKRDFDQIEASLNAQERATVDQWATKILADIAANGGKLPEPFPLPNGKKTTRHEAWLFGHAMQVAALRGLPANRR